MNQSNLIDILSVEKKEELKSICENMQKTSNLFYAHAVQSGNHGFIEFCGLMNEYIKICRQNIDNNVDFTQSNIHSGISLKIEPHEIAYIAEKIGCIFNDEFKVVFGKQSKNRQDWPEKIVCSAIWYDDGIIRTHLPRNIDSGIVASGLRHCNCYTILAALYPDLDYKKYQVEGFITSKNRFVDRTEAMKIAILQGQIKSKNIELHSEDLY